MNKHTPGPWDLLKLKLVWNVSKPSRSFMAGVQVSHTIANVQGNNEEAEANARLIAAAPELLAALKALYEHAPKPKKDGDAAHALAIVEASLAIAKAEGGGGE